MEEEEKQQLKVALMGAIGEGVNCMCNAVKQDDCFCGADWKSKTEKALERKLSVAIEALIEATTDIYLFGINTDEEFQKKNNLDRVVDKYETIADFLEE